MTASPGLKEHVADMVKQLTQISITRYFGGWALRSEGTQIAMIMDTLYVAKDLLEAAGFDTSQLEPFRYQTKSKTVTVGRYLSVPAELLDDANRLCRLLTAEPNSQNERHHQ